MLRVRLDANEQTVISQLSAKEEWAAVGLLFPLTPFTCLMGRDVLTYDVRELVPLKVVAKEGLTSVCVRRLLKGLLSALSFQSRGADGPCLLLSPRHVMLDRMGCPHFVAVPVRGGSVGSRGESLRLVAWLANALRTHATAPDDVGLCERLDVFVSQQPQVLSLVRLRAFLREDACLQDLPTHAAPGAFLCELDSYGGMKTYALGEGRTYLLGRAPSCDIVLSAYDEISRVHASMRCVPNGVVLRDEGSTNRTYVAGVPLVPHKEVHVGFGQTFALAGIQFRVEGDSHGQRD